MLRVRCAEATRAGVSAACSGQQTGYGHPLGCTQAQLSHTRQAPSTPSGQLPRAHHRKRAKKQLGATSGPRAHTRAVPGRCDQPGTPDVIAAARCILRETAPPAPPRSKNTTAGASLTAVAPTRYSPRGCTYGSRDRAPGGPRRSPPPTSVSKTDFVPCEVERDALKSCVCTTGACLLVATPVAVAELVGERRRVRYGIEWLYCQQSHWTA